MAGPGDLHALAVEYLEACAEAVSLSPGGALSHVYVSPGPPSWDCEQIAVHVGGPALADTAPVAPPLQPGRRPDDGTMVNLIALTATVIRCVPTVDDAGGQITFPPAADITAAAEKTNGDLWAIWNIVRRKFKAQEIFAPTGGSLRELFFDPAVALAAAGGFAGWQIQIRVQLDGYGG